MKPGLGIRSKVLLLMLGVAVPAVAAVGWLGWSKGKEALERSTFDGLTSLRASKARQIEAYLRGVRSQI